LARTHLFARARQWAALPVIPVAWLAFGALLMLATGVTKRLVQPPLSAHRPIPLFSVEFARWWLVQRLVGTVNLLFADQLRGTPALVWWFRMLVRPGAARAPAQPADPAPQPQIPAACMQEDGLTGTAGL